MSFRSERYEDEQGPLPGFLVASLRVGGDGMPQVSGFELGGEIGDLPPEVQEALKSLIFAFDSMSRISGAEPSGDYEVFISEDEREEVYEYSRATAEYIIDNDIESVVLLDRGARPMYVGIKECLKAMPDAQGKMPDFKFINPKGFRAKEIFPNRLEKKIYDRHYHHGDKKEKAKARRSRDEIMRDFEETYPDLIAKKDKPLLLLDTCLHGGQTILPVMDILGKHGFVRPHFGVIHSTGQCPLPPTFAVTPFRPALGCVPFHPDMMVQKTYGSVHSIPSPYPEDRQEAVKARREIRQIVREKLQRDGYLEAEAA